MENEKVSIDSLNSYDETFNLDDRSSINCYSKNKMQSLHPIGDQQFIGEFAKDSDNESISQFNVGDISLPMYRYKSHNRFAFTEKGFVKCSEKDKSYIVLLKNVLLARLLTILLILALILGAIWAMGNWRNVPPKSNDTSQSAEEDPNAENWTGAETPPGGSASGESIRVPGFKNLHIQADTRDIKVSLYNPVENNNYVILSIILRDTNEEIYKSGLIESGKGLYNITLTRPIPAGEYPATVRYEFFAKDKTSRQHSTNVNCTLIAKSA